MALYVQIGYGRAGFYSYDLLDNLGKPSADHIIPELQHIEIGTWIPMSANVSEETAFCVVDIGDFPMKRKLMLGIKKRAELSQGQTTKASSRKDLSYT